MNIGITGASGFVGLKVVDLALRRGHEVIAFTRRPERPIPGCEMRAFSLEAVPDFTGCEAVIHLAGESVIGLWTAAKQRRIKESRTQGTRRVVEGLRAATARPEVFVCASGTGIYAPEPEKELTEAAPLGTNFLAETARAWEEEAVQAPPEVREVRLRIGMVMGKEGGPLSIMRPLFKAGLGGQVSHGRQWVPWIHVDDLAMLILYSVENLEVRGPMNAVAPWPVRNRDLTQMLAKAVRRPAWFRVPAWALRLTLSGFADELIDSKRAVPAALTALGFRFRFPELEPALKDLLP